MNAELTASKSRDRHLLQGKSPHSCSAATFEQKIPHCKFAATLASAAKFGDASKAALLLGCRLWLYLMSACDKDARKLLSRPPQIALTAKIVQVKTNLESKIMV